MPPGPHRKAQEGKESYNQEGAQEGSQLTITSERTGTDSVGAAGQLWAKGHLGQALCP